MAPRGDFQAVHSLVVVHEGGDVENGNRHEFYRGDAIPGKLMSDDQAERFLELGAIRKASETGELPNANADAAAPTLTQPNGEPVELAPDAEIETGFKAPRSHAEADAAASEAGITFPAKAKLADKVEALRQVAEASAAGDTTPTATSEDISQLSDEELIQRGIDFGHTEDEMVELDHDGLVLFVAEAMARQGNTEAAQQLAVADRESSETAEPAPTTE